MSWREHVKAMVEYNQWANAKVLAACEGLSEDDLRKDHRASHGNLSDLLYHMGRVQAWWFSVASQTAMEPVCEQGAPFADLKELIERVQAKMVEWATSVAEAELAAQVRFPSYDGKTYTATAWQPLTTLLAHNTQHRAEIGMMLAAYGKAPGDVDFVYFASERAMGFVEPQ